MVKFGKGIFSRDGVYDQLKSINTPTLVIVGEEDIPTPLEKAKKIADGIPGASLKSIPHAGHLCTVEEPEVVTSAITDFLTKHQ